MDEFSTSRPVHLRNEGSGVWTLGAILIVLVLVITIIGLSSQGGSVANDTGAPDGVPVPVVAE